MEKWDGGSRKHGLRGLSLLGCAPCRGMVQGQEIQTLHYQDALILPAHWERL